MKSRSSNPKRLVVICATSALLVTLLALWKGDLAGPVDSSTVSVGSEVVPDLKLPPLQHDETHEMNATPAAAVPVPETVASTSGGLPADPPRPDAGYYDHPSRPYGVAGLLFFTSILTMSNSDTQAAINKIREAAQVDEATALAFLGYMRKAKEGLDQFESDSVGRLCAQRDAIDTPLQLAAAFDDADVVVESRRAQMTRGSESVLGTLGMRNFETYIASRDRGKAVALRNNAATLAALNKSPAEVLALYCRNR